MSVEYDQYLREHIAAVYDALKWMSENLDISGISPAVSDTDFSNALWEASDHDKSKFEKFEYDAYNDYFYGGNRGYKVVLMFNYAWLHHIHKNPHHWQYWVLLEDDPESGLPYKALEIPMPYILEMIADWWSFSWKSGNLFEIFNWYANHRSNQIINPKSREIVEHILEQIWKVLIMQETAAGRDISEIEKQYRQFWAEQDVDLLNWNHPSAQVIGKVVDTHETENGLEVTVKHSETEDDEDLYGVPELKKFPMPDKKHVKSAIRFFNYVDPKHEEELAKAILARIKEYGLILGEDITVGDDNRFKKYIPKEEQES